MTLAALPPVADAPPNDPDIEAAVLGRLIFKPADAWEAIPSLKADDFYTHVNKTVFVAMKSLVDRAEDVDLIGLKHELRRTKKLEAIGGVAELVRISNDFSGSLADNMRRLIDMARIRHVAHGASQILTEVARWDHVEADALVDKASELILEADTRISSSIRSVGSGLKEFLELTERRQETKGVPDSPYGWEQLDTFTGGLHAGRLAVVAARPGMGKTSWAGALALNVARRGAPVLFVSIEMSYDELLARLVANVATVPSTRMQTGTVLDKDWDRINNAVTQLERLPLEIAESPGATLSTIKGAARRAKAQHKSLGLVIVDYLQLMSSTGRKESRQVEVAEFSRGLKMLAKDLSVPVVALAQLNRDVEKRGDKRPELGDLRESGSIENDADSVGFLYRADYYDSHSVDRGMSELILRKNRHGPLGTVSFATDLSVGTWRDMPLQRKDF